MSNGYDLQHGEALIHRESEVKYGGVWANWNDDLLLTNKHLVLIRKGTFSGRAKGTQVFALSDIKVHNGSAQVLLGSLSSGGHSLDIYFDHGLEQFGMSSKKRITYLIQLIDRERTGRQLTAVSPQSSGSERFGAALKGAVGTLRDAFSKESAATQTAPTGSTPGVTKCSECGAPYGTLAEYVTQCEYCGAAIQPRKA